MKDFNSLVRDTLPVKNPEGTWRLGKNMLLTKGYKSIANEDGFSFEYLVKGTIIGSIVTNADIVYLSKNSDGTDEVGVVNTNNNTPTYKTVVKSSLFNFKYNCPIEGLFIYNFKNELIVSWCDGIKLNSNTPKILNTTNPPLALNADGTLINNNEFNKLNLFPNIKEATIDISYLDTGAIDGFAAYITYAYIFNDDSSTAYFSSSNLAYLGTGADPIDKKGIRVTFTDLDLTFSKLKIGIVLKKGGSFFGYESYTIRYTGTTKKVDITTLLNYTSISPDNIIIEKAIFEKVGTMTKYDSQAMLGNVITSTPINFQKYANLLSIKPIKYTPSDIQVAGLLPDEVYSLYIQLQFLNGSWSEAFHIPGRVATGTEKNVITAQQKIDYNLNWTDNISTGNFKQFHLFNNGSFVNNVNVNDLNNFGYWENEETYPNTDDFNSTVDYNNNNLSPTSDLRNQPIRYHKMPSINSVFDKGELNIADTIDANSPNNNYYKIGIQVENFGTIVPQEIKNKIQGYRMCFIKRNNGNSYIAGNWAMTRRGEQTWTQDNIPVTWKYPDFNLNPTSAEITFGTLDINFSKGKIISNELFKYRPTIDITYIKTNYLFRANAKNNRIAIDPKYTFGRILNNIKYVPSNNIVAGTQYAEEGIDIDIDYLNYIHINSGNSANRFNIANITAYSHKINLYSGFKSNNLSIISRTSDLTDNVIFKGGDVFNDVEIDISAHTVMKHTFSTRVVMTQYQTLLKIKGLFSPLNVSKLYNNYGDEAVTEYTIGDNVVPERIDSVYYDSRDYDFKIKHEADLSAINDINTILTFDFEQKFITDFPFRIQKGIKIPNENLSASSLRTFLTSEYFEMPNDKGEIIALRGKEKALFIQLRYTLFVASVKDTLKTQDVDAFLGRTNLFDRPPEELLSDEKGYIACTSKFSCIVVKGMYITVNQINGQIFIIKGTVKEISATGNKNWFWNNWDIGLNYFEIDRNNEKRRIDNPYVSIGHLVGFDKKYNRLLFTKKYYKFISQEANITTDGEFYYKNGFKLEFNDINYFKNESKTLSYNLENETWSFEHDYFPNMYIYTNANLYSIINTFNSINNSSVYKHNDGSTKGLFYGEKFPSYIDLIFNQNLKVSKLYQNISWITDVINNNGGNEKFKTITHIMLYNNHQCSGIINLKDNHFDLTRNIEDGWSIKDFRDLVINPSNPILDNNGEVIIENLNNLKVWFDKSNFISKFITIRLLIDNIDNDSVYIHEVKVNSLISNR